MAHKYNGATQYIWQHDDWPHMTVDMQALAGLVAETNLLRGQLMGRVSMFGFEEQNTSMLETMTSEIVHSSKIEGQTLSADSVRSSLATQLGLKYDGLPQTDHYIEGVVQVMLDATHNFSRPLCFERMFGWHHALFPNGYSGMYKISVGKWREGKEAMQVVSGAMGKERVHYEAPPSEEVPRMMNELLEWIETDDPKTDPLIKAAIAHLWFVTIHPFDDGNGRICRTITEMLLSRADHTGKRYYSLSSQILQNRKAYYDCLEHAQKGGMDVTEWVVWFLCTLKDAINASLTKTENVVRKRQFWNRHEQTPFNERQRKMLNRLFDGFEGKLNSSKWYKICHCSQDTATRDLNDLVGKGVLRKTDDGGRNTNYELNE